MRPSEPPSDRDIDEGESVLRHAVEDFLSEVTGRRSLAITNEALRAIRESTERIRHLEEGESWAAKRKR